jgi:hypothetical protein
MTPTVEDIKTAREQAKCGGHAYVPIATYCEHIDALLAEIEVLKNGPCKAQKHFPGYTERCGSCRKLWRVEQREKDSNSHLSPQAEQ